ncbi:MAG: ComEC/Rec2 family competence protein [Patescibacteria group bacterium]|nr:ComEC/Rec2 family competence protein [Patescibacteria group bacterium]MDD4304840.1 ComEC/Rec2 family competence protein [Patescibacteria group bacterium]
MRKSTYNLIIGIFFILGLCISNYFDIQNNIIIVSIFICILFLSFTKNINIKFYLFLILFLSLGIIFYNYSKIDFRDDAKIWYYNSETLDWNKEKRITFIGRITDEADVRIDHQKLKVSVSQITKPTQKNILGNTLVKTKLYPKFNYGDVLEITCYLIKPGKIENFAYDKYLSKDNIYSLCYDPQIKIIENKANIFISLIFKLKNFLFNKVNTIWSEPTSSFLNSALFGFEKLLPNEIDQDFRNTGLSHIVVVSGMHVTIIIVVFSKILYSIGINRKRMFFALILFLFVFAVLSGLSSSIIRASIMGIIVVFSKNIGRYIPNHLVIVYSLVIISLMNPLLLFYDIGFQLSFLATIGLIYLSPIIKVILKFMPETLEIREITATSLGAMIMTTPITMYSFQKFSTFGILSNILILPFISFDMTLAVFTIPISFISNTLAQYFGFLSYVVTKLLFALIKLISNIKISVLNITDFNYLHMFFCYLIIIIIYFYAKKEKDI